MSDFDYIVIGAGIEGSWTALQLVSLQSCRVLLLDQFSLPHTRGSSHGYTRIIRHAYTQKFYTQMMPQSYKDWLNLEKQVNEKLFIKKPLLLYGDESGYEALNSTLETLRDVFPDKEGLNFRELSSSDLATEYPELKLTERHRGCIDLTAGLLLADRSLSAVQRRFVELGGVLQDGIRVTLIEPGSSVTITTINEKTKAVKQLIASKVAVCAGPWTSKLLDPLLTKKLPLTTLRVPVHYWKIKQQDLGFIDASFKDMSGDMTTEFWGIPECEYPGLVKISQASQDIVDPDCSEVNVGHIDHTDLSQYIAQHFPGIESAKPAVTVTCLYSMTPDEVCIMDLLPGHNNVAFACGFSGSGFKKAPVVGRFMSQLLNPPVEVDVTPFALSRFI